MLYADDFVFIFVFFWNKYKPRALCVSTCLSLCLYTAGWRRTPKRSCSRSMSAWRGHVRNSACSTSTSPTLKVCTVILSCGGRRGNHPYRRGELKHRGMGGVGSLLRLMLFLFSQLWGWPIRERRPWFGTKRQESLSTTPLVGALYIWMYTYHCPIFLLT